MKCDNCKLVEMFVDKVTENAIHYKCKKCGKELEKEKEKQN